MAKRTAVIDIGSNSVRMVIYEKSSRFAFSLIHESRSRVRISENSYQNGSMLQEIAMSRADSALSEFVSIASSYGVRKVLCVATSAVRDASNANEFVSSIKKRLSLKIKVIDGEREAYLGAIAAANLLAPVDAMAIDLGGGSMEFAQIRDALVDEHGSIDLGSVRIKELFLDRGDLSGARAFIEQKLAEISHIESKTIVGIGGTFRSLAQIIQKNEKYPYKKLHGYRFSSQLMLDLIDKILCSSSTKELKDLGIKSERLDIIKSGAVILEALLRKSACKELICSGVGVREGVYLADLLRHSRDRFPHNFNPSLKYLLDRHVLEPKFSSMLSSVTAKLFDLLYKKLSLSLEYREILLAASKLTTVGVPINFYSYHKRSHYLILNALSYGYTHEQIITIATLVRSHKHKKVSKTALSRHKNLLPSKDVLSGLNMILSLADALLAHRPKSLDLKFSIDHKERLCVESKSPLYLAKEQIASLRIDTELDIVYK